MILKKQCLAREEELPFILAFAENALREGFTQPKFIHQVLIAIEEVALNVIKYAYHGGIGDIEMTLEIKRGESVFIEIIDSGSYFNPTTSDIDAPLPPIEELQPGGRGIVLARKMMDHVRYMRKNDENHLIMQKKL